MLYKVFNEQVWQDWISKFSNVDFDVYEVIEEIDVNHDFTYEASVADQKLHVHEILDFLKDAFFRMQEDVQHLDSTEVNKHLNYWILNLQNTSQPLIQAGIQKFV